MSKLISLLYGVVCYAVFFLAFLYAIAFVGNWFAPKTIDSGDAASLGESLAVNLVLLSLFAGQHTIMARPGFKHWFTKFAPAQVERSTFVLASSLLLILMYWQWRPMTGVVWSVENPAGRAVLVGLCGLGWLTVLLSTFLIDHFDLFGLRQVWLHFRGAEYTHHKFQTRALYKYVRHPIMLGFAIAFWATPDMTVGHLLFAGMTTGYIIVGIQFEERDLVSFLGDDYAAYRRQVPMLLPIPGKRAAREEP
ncbi:MAG: isoprenylcysteine carboxylmethyltransferase family protein [Planctomycetes bacterium]|nr:isoprenylcysteine carboxylmethyltransferase family protein [Planctomycetota bacterium]